MAEPRIALRPVPLTAARFAPFGDVIDTSGQRSDAMNEARFERFDDLCDIDVGAGRIAVSVARCRTPTALPYRIDRLERHPLGSQAFVPLRTSTTLIVVAPPVEHFDIEDLRAFATVPGQGFNYHRGTWHMPLIGRTGGDAFLIVDRQGDGANCEERILDEHVVLEDS